MGAAVPGRGSTSINAKQVVAASEAERQAPVLNEHEKAFSDRRRNDDEGVLTGGMALP